jgi:tetratricopeptide (TPR) repeat protein
MKTEYNKTGETGNLRATISILTRGGPFKVNVYQSTNPVLLRDIELPAEASYVFSNPALGRPYVNLPISIELFFGENGREEDDISLGKFQLKYISPSFAGSIEIKLAVSAEQILSIAVLDHTTLTFRSIGFIDISKLAPPEIKIKTKNSGADQNKFSFQQLSDLFLNPKPRDMGKPRRGEDISQVLTISFEEAVHGAKKDIRVISTETCPVCSGSGVAPGKTIVHCVDCRGTGLKKEETQTDQGPLITSKTCPTCKGDGLIIADPCRNCKGNGWVKTTHPITLQIPACIDSGAEVCIPHQGEPGRYGGYSGHLRISTQVAPHPLFARVGSDISIRLPVSTGFAKDGGHLRVPDVKKGNSFLMKMPADVKSDMTFQVFESEDYTLTAQIEIYRPALLFALPNVKKRLQAINEALGHEDLELPASFNGVGAVQAAALDELEQREKSSSKHAESTTSSTWTTGRSRNDAKFYTRRGIIYAEKGDWVHALADYNKALELNPDHASAYDSRSALYMSQHEPEKALADLNKEIELEPNNAEYHEHRGMLYHIQKDLAMALADYDKALALDPNNARVYDSRGRLYASQENLAKALSDFSAALRLDPHNAEYYYHRGEIYEIQNKLPQALADYTKSLEMAPNDSKYAQLALGSRGNVYLRQNNLEKALADADKAVQMYSDNARAYNNRGHVYSLRNDWDKAVADYSKAIKLDPNFVYAYNGRGNAYLKQACYNQAVKDFDKSLALKPGDIYVSVWLGQAYQGLGENSKAIALYRRVLDANPNPELRQEAQDLLDNLGRK